MRELAGHGGSWAGTNAFRLMPGDPTQDAPLRATLSPAAKGGLTQLAYTWAHPDDGDQEGLLVIGPGPDPATVTAFWGDSWHQQPQPRSLDGAIAGGTVTVAYVYAGDWGWEIVVDVTVPEQLTVTMNNVIPASAATADMGGGPYAAMHAVLRREG